MLKPSRKQDQNVLTSTKKTCDSFLDVECQDVLPLV